MGRTCKGGGTERKVVFPWFCLRHCFPVPTVEPQGASAQGRGLVPSQANKPNQGAGGEGMQSTGGLEPKGELKLHIWEIHSCADTRQIQHFRELRNK